MRVFAAFACVVLIHSAMAISRGQRRQEFSGCGGNFTKNYGLIKNVVGPQTRCIWTIKINSSKQIVFRIPDLELDCQNEKLEILDGAPPESVSLGIFCRGHRLSFRISTNFMTIRYSRNPNHAPYVFYIYYHGYEKDVNLADKVRRVHSDCGGIITDLGGKIINYFGPKTLCIWTIKMKSNYRISVIIPVLNLTSKNESLEVLDGAEGAVTFGRIYEGSDMSYWSSSNIASIKYSRTPKQRPTYFTAYFYGVPEGVSDAPRPAREERECGGVLTDPFGTIATPGVYSPQCIWIITLKPREKVILKTMFVDLTCVNEYLEILDGPLGSRVLGRLCRGCSLIYKSTLNIMTVKYVTNSSRPRTTFAMDYYGVPESKTSLRKSKGPGECDGLAINPLGWFNSKGNNISCIWTVLIKPTYQGLLAFPFLGLPCETERTRFQDYNFSVNTYERVCPSISFTYKILSDHTLISYYRNSIHEPKLLDAYLYSDSEKTTVSPTKKRGHKDCGSHLAHSTGKYLSSFGPRISCVWKIHWKPSGDVLAYPMSRLSCATEKTEGSFGHMGWDYFWKICKDLSFSYKPFSGHVKISYLENWTGSATSTDAFFYAFSKVYSNIKLITDLITGFQTGNVQANFQQQFVYLKDERIIGSDLLAPQSDISEQNNPLEDPSIILEMD